MKKWDEMSKLEKQIEIIKFCHEPRTRKEIAEHFKIDDRILRRYLNDYMNNIQFPGTEFQINLIKKGNTIRADAETITDAKADASGVTYTSSAHPVLLALNMSQVFLLTVGMMDRIGKEDVMYEAYQEMANLIYSQLSDYGKNIIDSNDHGHGFDEIFSSAFASEKELFADSHFSKLAYLMKSEREAKITFVDSTGKMQTVKSKLKFRHGGYTFMMQGEAINLNSIEITDIQIDSYR